MLRSSALSDEQSQFIALMQYRCLSNDHPPGIQPHERVSAFGEGEARS